MATVYLSNYADYYDASYSYRNDTIYALRGEDNLYLGSGRDIAYGGDGADYIYGNGGDDTLNGGTGYDYLEGGDGFDRLNGDAGSDTLTDYDANGVYNGGDGNDYIHVHGGTVNGGTGADTVVLHNLTTSANVTLGTQADTLDLEMNGYYGSPATRVTLKDFKVEDHLDLHGYDQNANYIYEGQILDGLDRNNDGWLGLKDVEQYDDGDGFEVITGTNFLELHVGDDTLVLAGMNKASFDFLS